MKNKLLSFILLFICFSCTDEIINETIENTSTVQESKGVVYPKKQKNTRSTDTHWEDWLTVRLASGSTVNVPWHPTVTTGTIPTHIRIDIKEEDGWELIAHTVNTNSDPGSNYMLFHNKFTGTLKVFYYLEEVVMQTTAIWKVYIDTPQNLLAFSEGIADAADSPTKRQEIFCANITSNENKGFTRGWNCFQFDLAYDPDFSAGRLVISPVSRTESEITITGNYQSKSEGTIITTTKKEKEGKSTKGIAKASGKEAENWLKNQLTKGKISQDHLKLPVSDIVSQGPAGFIKGGVTKLLKSFSGSSQKLKTYESKLEFMTNGTVELAGSISTELTGGLVPATINISKENVGTLGVWNLSSAPVTYFSSMARPDNSSGTKYPINTFFLFPGPKTEYHFCFNPELSNTRREVSTLMTRSMKEPNIAAGSIGGGFCTSDSPYKPIYEEEDVYMQDFQFRFTVAFPNLPPDRPYREPIFAPKGKDIHGFWSIGIKNDHFLKVSVILFNSANNDTIATTRTFRTSYEWDPKTLDENKELYKEDYYIIDFNPGRY